MKTTPTPNIQFERQLAARTLAATILADADKKATQEDHAALQELIRWVTAGFLIVHRRHPTLHDLAVVVDTYKGDKTLAGQAVRNASGRDEQREAAHCTDWVKSCTNTSMDYVWLKSLLGTWCQEHEEEASKAVAPLTGDERARAAEAASWELDESNSAQESGSEDDQGAAAADGRRHPGRSPAKRG